MVGPRLVVPYRRPTDGDVETGFLSFLPASLAIDGDVDASSLRRGLFTIPVYEARPGLRGRFEPPDLAVLGLTEPDVSWEAASLVVEVSDPRAVGGRSSLTWNGEGVAFAPGTKGSSARPGIHGVVSAPLSGAASFEVALDLKGTNRLWFVPFARDTRVDLASNWPHPSFSGAWLPAEREVRAEGFTATAAHSASLTSRGSPAVSCRPHRPPSPRLPCSAS